MLFYFKFIIIWFLFHLGIFGFLSALLISGALFYKDFSLHRKNCMNKQQVPIALLKFCLITFIFTLWTSCRCQSVCWKDSCFITFTLCPLLHFYHDAHLTSLMIMMMIIVIVIVIIIFIIIIIIIIRFPVELSGLCRCGTPSMPSPSCASSGFYHFT